MSKDTGNPVAQLGLKRQSVIKNIFTSYYAAAKSVSTPEKVVYGYNIKKAIEDLEPLAGFYWREIDPNEEPELYKQAWEKKVCKTCKEEKSVAAFSKRKEAKDGLNGECKICWAERMKKCKENDPDYEKKRLERLRRAKERRATPEGQAKVKARKKKEWEKIKSDPLYRKLYEQSQRKHFTDVKKHKESYKEKMRMHYARRRTRKLGNGCENFTKQQLKEHWAQEGINPEKCYYCEEAPFEHIDHYVPLAKGGPHFMSNLRPSCASCNLDKSDQDPEEWLRARKEKE